jgi:hypothetical protein
MTAADDRHNDLSVEALPYTLLLLVAQFTAGVAALVLFVQLRGAFEAGFLRVCTWLTISGAALTMLIAVLLDPRANIDSYRLDEGYLDPAAAVAMALLLFSVVQAFFVRREDEAFLARATGATTVALGFALLLLLSALVRPPTWSIAGTFLTLVAGSVSIGACTVAMIWGHWYLVNPRLDEGPLNELALITLGALGIELAVTALNAIVPVGTPFESNALLAIDLPENPGFWLRVGIGLLLPIALAFMAYLSSRERSMMSATGLLYIAVGAVLAGEAVGRGLLFVTGAPV